ncbi:MAG: hypothetical protein K1W24_09120 [Lachnospiraceae bacterium]
MISNQKADGKESFKGKEGNMDEMTMTETARLILGLRAAGFGEKEKLGQACHCPGCKKNRLW